MERKFKPLALCLTLAMVCSHGNAQSRKSAVKTDGRQIFASSCAGCHGLDGRGGERAPDILSPHARQFSDTQIVSIVSHGVPGTGMPAFRSLGDSGIRLVVKYLRELQARGNDTALPGDAARGKSAFFGEAGCSDCHSVGGNGGFLGPDLSAYARSRSVEEIRQAILDPGKRNRKRLVAITCADGRELRGIIRNEDNFSLQLQSADGSFHLLMKSDLRKVDRDQPSPMPSDYATRLTRQQLDDVVSYLFGLGTSQGSAPPKDED